MIALACADVRVEHASGEFVAVTGRWGSGKSTLLHLIGGLDQPSTGRVLIDDTELWRGAEAERHRRDVVGFVFQQHHLLNHLTAQGNAEVARLGAGLGRREHRARSPTSHGCCSQTTRPARSTPRRASACSI